MKLIIRNGHIWAGNPAAEKICDLLIEDDHIAAIGDVPPITDADVIDASDKLVLPALVDPHAHFIGGDNAGYFMLAAAGVATALDPIIGRGEDAVKYMRATPAGLNIGWLYLIKPGSTVSGPSPKREEFAAVIEQAVNTGAMGVKIAGAHFPLTPDATAMAIEVAAEKHVPLMLHAGTTAERDDFAGMREAVSLSNGNPFILAHINAYCNGNTCGSQCAEAVEALQLLRDNPRIVSESTLSDLSCMGTRMINGIPESLCMIDVLENLGFPGTYAGMLDAVASGKLMVSGPAGKEFRFYDPSAGLARCREHNGAVTVGFKRHDMVKNAIVASGRRNDESFVVNAFSTDGGVIPRNVVLDKGLAMVNAGFFTMTEFVAKSATAGAKLLGLEHRKGFLAVGADADIVIANPATRHAEVTISNGKIIYRNGEFFPTENKIFSLDKEKLPDWLN